MAIPAIDIFAGLGGLAEGFSHADFDIRLFIEMDEHAHETLRTNYLKSGHLIPSGL